MFAACVLLSSFSPYFVCELRLCHAEQLSTWKSLTKPLRLYRLIVSTPLSSFTLLSCPPCLRLPLGRTLSSTQCSLQLHCHHHDQEYGYLSYYHYVVLSIEQVDSLVPAVSTRGLTTPLLFSSQALDVNSSGVRCLI